MAHCVHMTDEEIGLLKKYSTGVAHCPASNMLVQVYLYMIITVMF